MRGPIQGYRGHLALFVAACVIGGGLFVAALGVSGAFHRSSASYRFQAVVPDALSLGPKSEVRMAGLKVGQVSAIKRRGDVAVLMLELERKYAPIRRNARVSIRLKTLVGENYVDLYPGDARARPLPDRGVLPIEQARPVPQIDQVLSVLDPKTRAHTRRLLRGLGEGLAGGGSQVNDLVRDLSATTTGIVPVSRVLAQDRAKVARIVDNLGAVMRAVGDRGADLERLARDGRRTAEAVAARDAALRAALPRLPGTLAQVRRTTTTLERITRTTTPVVSDLATAVERLRPAIDELRPAAQQGREVVRELGRASPPLTRTLASLHTLSDPAAAALPNVHDVLRQLNPVLAYLAPYARELGTFFANNRSGSNYFDATGHAARIHAVITDSTPVAYSPAMSRAVEAILSSGVLGKIHTMGSNAYPSAGDVGTPKPYAGGYPRIMAQR